MGTLAVPCLLRSEDDTMGLVIGSDWSHSRVRGGLDAGYIGPTARILCCEVVSSERKWKCKCTFIKGTHVFRTFRARMVSVVSRPVLWWSPAEMGHAVGATLAGEVEQFKEHD